MRSALEKMSLLKTEDQERVRTMLAESVQRPVRLVLFTSEYDCPTCDAAHEIVSTMVELNENLSLEVLDLEQTSARAAELGVDKAPGLVILGGTEQQDYGIRFYGLPSGYEFASLLEAIRMVGADEVELQPATRAALEHLTTPLHLQVFVTPTCPYCPQAVVLAHRLAYASAFITADMVEVSEFPELGDRYEVMGVPRTVIADVAAVEGAVPEGVLRAQIEQAAQTLGRAA